MYLPYGRDFGHVTVDPTMCIAVLWYGVQPSSLSSSFYTWALIYALSPDSMSSGQVPPSPRSPWDGFRLRSVGECYHIFIRSSLFVITCQVVLTWHCLTTISISMSMFPSLTFSRLWSLTPFVCMILMSMSTINWVN